MYRSPGHKVPWWVQIWIKRSPLAFLSLVTSTITTILTAFTSFGLAAVSAWFASERWTYTHHQGRKWLGDILDDAHERFLQIRAMVATRRMMAWGGSYIKQAGLTLSRVPSFYAPSHAGSDTEKPEDGELPFTHNPNNSGPMSPSGRQSGFGFNSFDPGRPVMSAAAMSSDGHSEYSGTTEVASQISPARQRLQQAVRSVIMMQGGMTSAFMSRGKKSENVGEVTVEDTARKEMEMDMARSSRVGSLVPKLRQMEPLHDLAGHQALVKHLQFSPDGQFLATSSWDRTSLIFRVGEPEPHRVLAHPQGFVGQVAWSPDGKYLMTKLTRAIKIWTQDGVCKRTIERHRTVQSVTWVPDGKAFMSVEGSSVIKLDHTGKVLDTYLLQPVILHDVAVTPGLPSSIHMAKPGQLNFFPDGSRLVGVGPLQSSPTGLNPSTSRVEKRLIIYNMETQKVENQTPVMHDVRDITITKNGLFALISYEDKAPPQLWRIEMVKDREDPSIVTARLNLRHTFMPKVPIDFAGPSYFGGKDDQLVLCAGKAGDIHIWHRTSGALLRHIRGQEVGADLTCIAWNSYWEDPFMFGTGSHDGAVRIWSSPSPGVDSGAEEQWSTPKQSNADASLLMRKDSKKPAAGSQFPVAPKPLRSQSSASSESGLLRLPSPGPVQFSPYAGLDIPPQNRLSPSYSTLPNIMITSPDDTDHVHQRTIAFAPTP
ncbi:hypothetical protein HWV62_30047 [Athelia sp. TMB]|nr:hypothetical protein HWV62_30047 [Athelia sp. TMB]